MLLGVLVIAGCSEEMKYVPVARNFVFISLDFQMSSSFVMSVSRGNRWLLFNSIDLGWGFLSTSKISRGKKISKTSKAGKVQTLLMHLWVFPGCLGGSGVK